MTDGPEIHRVDPTVLLLVVQRALEDRQAHAAVVSRCATCVSNHELPVGQDRRREDKSQDWVQ
jgi:hypothetical protein